MPALNEHPRIWYGGRNETERMRGEIMRDYESALQYFHPLVASWFAEAIGTPTDLQMLAWPRVAAGEHVLITAPTGSGKTMAAFLWAINELITGKWTPGRISVLYVSPLKALNNDIRRNLLRPLSALKALFHRAGKSIPPVRVAVRSGDTPQSERRRMLREPPEILITTPESLNLLLSSHGGRSILTDIRTVILDEVHAVVGNKRGVHLITGVDRLVPLSGEFQRLALSATVRPVEVVAQYIGGYRMSGDPQSPVYTARPVGIISSSRKKDYRITVRFPDATARWDAPDAFWQPFVHEIKDIIAKNRATLVFTNSRRLCEKITHMLNEDEPAPLAYAHHGSLSREIRAEVEKKLKDGELRAMVATNSLELGIDIGVLDEVILLQAPPSLSSAIQRIGRAGHQVGEASRGTLLPTEPQDVLQAAVLAGGVLAQQIEPVRPVSAPLDVLAQIIVSMTGMETWNLDNLYAWLRTSYPYQSLSRRLFDLVIEMLAGRFSGSRLRELEPRIAVERLENTAAARKGALQAVYFSGGTIPDRGYFHLRHVETGARIGELDEEFVWEAKIGQVFTLSTQNWRIERITHNDVFVAPARPGAAAPPFWKAEENLRDTYLSERIADFLEAADRLLEDLPVKGLCSETSLKDSGLQERLSELFRDLIWVDDSRHHLPAFLTLERSAMERLAAFLLRQREASGRPLPHRHHLLVEHIEAGPAGYPGNQIVLHTIWGGRINRPFAMALDAAWEDRYGYRPELFPGNDCLVLQLPHDVDSEEILSLVTRRSFSGLIRRRLEGSGFFGARFRECAGRALLLSRRRMNERMPLWLSRLHSQRLLDSVVQFEDFPMLLEAWRTCLQDELDLDGLAKVLCDLESRTITWSEAYLGHPSPMARAVSWPQINRYMYMDDRSAGKGSKLRPDLLREVMSIPELRPVVSREAAENFELKRRRLSPGYSPENAPDLIEWVKERLLLPQSEWERLVDAMVRDHQVTPETLLASASAKLVWICPPEAAEPLLVAIENLPRICRGFHWDLRSLSPARLDSGGSTGDLPLPDLVTGREAAEPDDRDELFSAIISEWLQFYAPRSLEFVRASLGLDDDRLAVAVEALIDVERLVSGHLVEGDQHDAVCDSRNFEILLRLSRAAAKPAFTALSIEYLQLFLAEWQGLAAAKDAQGQDQLFRSLEQLVCCPGPTELWEEEVLPARLAAYDPSRLDSIMQQSDLRWVGTGVRRVAFCFEQDLDLLQEERRAGERILPADEDEAMDNEGNETASEPSMQTVPAASERARESGRPLLRLVAASRKATDDLSVPVTGKHALCRLPNEAEKIRCPDAPAEAGKIGNDEALDRIFFNSAVRYHFSTLMELSNLEPAALADMIWNRVWRGEITNDTFACLRHGIENNFRIADTVALLARRSRRRLRSSGRTAAAVWKGSLPMAGNWMRVPWPRREDDLLERAERDKERVRVLLERYGILFRELLQNELPAFGWGNVFRSLRLMELSGEVLTGYFFEGVPGPQFISPEAFRRLKKKLPEASIYWICAADPVSVCGMRLEALKGKLPHRLQSNHLVYHGRKLVMESRRNGKTLIFHVPGNSPHLQDYLGVLHHLLKRRFQPLRRIVIETSTPITVTDLERHLRKQFDVEKDGSKLYVYIRHGFQGNETLC